MSWWNSRAQPVHVTDKTGRERRKDPRIGGHFKVRYSGSDADKIIMGHAPR